VPATTSRPGERSRHFRSLATSLADLVAQTAQRKGAPDARRRVMPNAA